MSNILKFGLMFVCIVSFFPFQVDAMDSVQLSLSPAGGSYRVGDIVSVKIFVASPDQEVNAVSGNISFPVNLLEPTALIKTGSIVSLWAQEPSFEKATGNVQFEGVIFNPAFKGKTGTLLTVNFRVKAVGSAPLRFVSGSVLANDGLGTNVLGSMKGADFALLPALPKVKVVEPESFDVPVIRSSTHPDSNRWYADSNPQFEWDLPYRVTGVAFSVNEDPYGSPGTKSKGLVSSYTHRGIENGRWYLHVRFEIGGTGWGVVTHFPFNVDTEEPERVYVAEVVRKDGERGVPAFVFSSKDAVSGIDHYEVSVDHQLKEIQSGEGVRTYQAHDLAPGFHTLTIEAVDKAGNVSIETISFSVGETWRDVFVRYRIVMGIGSLCIGVILLLFVKRKRAKEVVVS